MKSTQSELGTCPHCDTPISNENLLIEYTRFDDQAAYAECPSCTTIVRPR